jgi:TolA-binding protein
VAARERRRLTGSLAGVAVVAVALAAGCAQETSPLVREDFDRLRADLLRSQQAVQKSQADLRTELQQGDARTVQTLTELQRSVTRLQSRVDELARDTGQIQGRLDEVRKRIDLLSLQLDVVGVPSQPGSGTSSRSGSGPGPVAGSGAPGGPASGPRAAPSPPAAAAPAGAGPPAAPTPGGPGPAASSAAPSLTPGGAGSPAPPAGPTLAAGPGAAGIAPPASAPNPQRAAAVATSGSDLYQTAYLDYIKGNYGLAIAGFREYLRQNPAAELSEKAKYWIGESYFSQARLLQSRGDKDRAQKEFEQAIQAFRQVYVEHPRGDRVPAAAYKEALTLIEIGQPALAEARLQWLVDSYPSTEEAAKAQDDLTRIRKR